MKSLLTCASLHVAAVGYPSPIISPLSNEVTYAFNSADERSMQARYDYNFAALGIPGLTTIVR